jgi:hypothetical protein
VVCENDMIDEATGMTIAYQTDYIYFTLEIMDFRSCFSVFHFSLIVFMNTDNGTLEQSENIVYEKGKIIIHDFATPVVNTSLRISHMRILTYINNDSAIVIQAFTAPVLNGDDIVDEPKSLERYLQSDKELIGMMQSLIVE